MNRHRAYWPLDDAPAPDGDGVFLGVNARLQPDQLADGEVADAVNMRFDSGSAAPRWGLRILPWGAQGFHSYDPGLIAPYGDVVTAATYRDPIAGVEWMIVATANGTYRCRPGSTGMSISGPPGMQVPAGSRMIQTYNGLVMLRGASLDPLYLRDVDEGWLNVPEAAAGYSRVPRGTEGLYWANRLFVVDARAQVQYVDSVWVSDFGGVGSVLQGDRVYQSFKINQGSADRLVAVYPFNATTLVAAKQRSVYVVSYVEGTNDVLAANARLDQVTGEWGCLAPRSLVQVGSDVWLLAHRRGVCSLRLTETNAIQGVDVPVSRDIQPIIDRINWSAAGSAVAAAHDNRVYFAVPIDGASYNNAILVYSTLTQKWAGYDSSPAIKVRDWIKFPYEGAVRLGYVSTDGFLYQLDFGIYDETGSATGEVTRHEIGWRWRSRGYGGRSPGAKRFTRLRAKVATHGPTYTVKVVSDGVSESAGLPTRTKSRLKWHRPHGKSDWDPTNAANDFAAAHRQDYSWPINSTGIRLGSGIPLNAHQETEDVYPLRASGQQMQVEWTGVTGRVVVKGQQVDMQRIGQGLATRS